MKFKDDEYELSTGKTFYSNNGILGICGDGALYEGYDGAVEYPHEREEPDAFTANERREIADYMIELWSNWGGL